MENKPNLRRNDAAHVNSGRQLQIPLTDGERVFSRLIDIVKVQHHCHLGQVPRIQPCRRSAKSQKDPVKPLGRDLEVSGNIPELQRDRNRRG